MISWGKVGIDVLAFALNFQLLANRRPEFLDGIYSYARAGFGGLVGFLSAWGYWISGVLGNVCFFTMMVKTLRNFTSSKYSIPPSNNFILASAILWIVHFIQKKGARNVEVISAVSTVAKLLPLGLVIVLGFHAFNPDIFLWIIGQRYWQVRLPRKSQLFVSE